MQTEFRYEEGTEYSEPMANWVEFEVKMHLPYKETQSSDQITILPYDGGYAFDLKSGSFVYHVTAEWDDGNRVEYGFVGKWL